MVCQRFCPILINHNTLSFDGHAPVFYLLVLYTDFNEHHFTDQSLRWLEQICKYLQVGEDAMNSQ